MTDEEFAALLKNIADKSDLDKDTKKEYCLLIAAACDNKQHESLIVNKLKRDGITFEALFEYAVSILPPVEIVDDE